MTSNINKAYVNACKPLDQAQSEATYLEIEKISENLQFLHTMLEIFFKHSECIETYCLPGMIELIQNQLSGLHKASLILCPEIDCVHAADIQKEIETFKKIGGSLRS